jgi:N-acetylglutamate synthase/N-acetylornithine aminotransferase
MNAMLFAYLIVGAPSFSIDANLATLLGLVVTSLTSIALAVINWLKSRSIEKQSASIEKKVDEGNAVTTATHVIANGRTDSLLKQLEEKNAEIQRLSALLPPPADK